MIRRLIGLTCLVLLLGGQPRFVLLVDARLSKPLAAAGVLFVDGSIGAAACTSYDPGARLCGSGSASAYRTLGGAVAVAQPGDTVLIREGTYTEQLKPLRSGSPGNPITFGGYPGETAALRWGSSPATILLDHISHITVENLRVEDSRWVEAVSAQFIVLRGNTFLRTPASGTTGNVRFVSSDHNQILGNTLDSGNDNLLLIDSDYNLVEGNTMREGRHSLLSIRCSNYNVIRGNYFSNTQQKIAEVYDCGQDTTIVPHAFNATHHNVIERNIFAEASAYYSTSGGNGIQYAGQDGIIRQNVFYATNVGLGMQVYDDEALNNHRNRVIHNVFYGNDCAGIAVRGDALDNIYKNNILYQNQGIGGGDCFGSGPAQVVYRTPLANYLFERNVILYGTPGEDVIWREFGSGEPLAFFETNYPGLYAGNLELDPQFFNPAAHDFTLQADSPMIDAGVFVTHTLASGSGTGLPVADARYFHDGFGIEGVVGDLLQLEGQAETARIQSVDYGTDTLTLDRALSWSAGQGISPAFQGSGPDIGAYEGPSPWALLPPRVWLPVMLR